MTDSAGLPVRRANPNALIRLQTEPALASATPYGLLRKKVATTGESPHTEAAY